MGYRLKPHRSLTRDLGAIAAALFLALSLAADARAQTVGLRYMDADGRVLSISTMGTIVEFPVLPGSQQAFSPVVQEGFTLAYNDNQLAWAFGAESSNLVSLGWGGPLSGIYGNGTTIDAFVALLSQDGLLYIENRFRWFTGTSRVEVDTVAWKNVADQPDVLLRGHKRFVAVGVRAGEAQMVGTNGDQEAFVTTQTGRRFTLAAGFVRPEDLGSIIAGSTDVARAAAYFVDLSRRPFALPDDSFAQQGVVAGSSQVLVGSVNERRLPGGGSILGSPDYGSGVTTVYTAS